MNLVKSDRITIVSLDDISNTELEQIDIRLRTLIQCTELTIPGSRRFGLARDYLDEPINVAVNTFAAELQEKCDIYLPEISIASVVPKYDLAGQLELTIKIDRGDRND